MNKNLIIPAAIAAFLLLFRPKATGGTGGGNNNALMAVSFLNDPNQPRGIRNNNPGNLEKSNNAWKGKISNGTDIRFEQFNFYVFGVRAMIILLKNYYVRYNLNTVAGIINRYAPPSDNPNGGTANYIKAVENATGFGSSSFTWNQDNARKLVQAMAYHENGRPAIDADMFNLAWYLI